MEGKKFYYYRIYDDKEKFDFIKSSLPYSEIEKLLKCYEETHQKFFNIELVDYLRKEDPEAEIIEVSEMSY